MLVYKFLIRGPWSPLASKKRGKVSQEPRPLIPLRADEGFYLTYFYNEFTIVLESFNLVLMQI